MERPVYLLTGDIGGTNSRMSLYSVNASCCNDEPLFVKYFRNSEHLPANSYSDPESFQDNIIIPFLRYCWEEQPADAIELHPLRKVTILAALATAGIVSNNKVNMTNLGNLLVDGNAIAKNTRCTYLKHITVCKIINDFVAQGYGCLTLSQDEVKPLYGPAKLADLPVGPKVCIGAGTGLGECYLTPTSDGDGDKTLYKCFPSEGGHVEYAPRNDLEVSMFTYLSDKFSSKHRVSVERVVSGKGLANVYEFLATVYPTRIVEEVNKEFVCAGDEQGKVVAMNATEGSLCRQAMEIMMSAYGCEAGSAAIKWIPTGGLFVTGGLTPKNIKFIEGNHTDFMISYLNKGRVSSLLETIPVFAVMVEDLGVRGAHKAALMEYEIYLNDTSVLFYTKTDRVREFVRNFGLLTATALCGLAAGMMMGAKRR